MTTRTYRQPTEEDRQASAILLAADTIGTATAEAVGKLNIMQLAAVVKAGILTQEQAIAAVWAYRSYNDVNHWFTRSNFFTRRQDTVRGLRSIFPRLVEQATEAEADSALRMVPGALDILRLREGEGQIMTTRSKKEQEAIDARNQKASADSIKAASAEGDGAKAAKKAKEPKPPKEVKLHPAVEAVACPTCGQPAGKRCVGPAKGDLPRREVNLPHATRIKAAQGDLKPTEPAQTETTASAAQAPAEQATV